MLVILSEQSVVSSGDHRKGYFFLALIVSLHFLSIYLMPQYQELLSVTLVFRKLAMSKTVAVLCDTVPAKGRQQIPLKCWCLSSEEHSVVSPEDCSPVAHCCENLVSETGHSVSTEL
jgi:hypothetical protein